MPKNPANETHKLLGTSRPNRQVVASELDQVLARYEAAKLELEHFRQQHAGVVEQLDALRAEVASAFEDAKSIYAANHEVLGPSYGGFHVVQKRTIDAEKLIKLMPDAIVLVKYTMPVEKFDSLVLDGTISTDIAEQVASYRATISGPKR